MTYNSTCNLIYCHRYFLCMPTEKRAKMPKHSEGKGDSKQHVHIIHMLKLMCFNECNWTEIVRSIEYVKRVTNLLWAFRRKFYVLAKQTFSFAYAVTSTHPTRVSLCIPIDNVYVWIGDKLLTKCMHTIQHWPMHGNKTKETFCGESKFHKWLYYRQLFGE